MLRVNITRRPERDRPAGHPGPATCWQLYWQCPQSGKRRKKLAWGTQRDAERAAIALEQQLALGADPAETSWQVARQRFALEYLRDRPKATRDAYHSALNAMEKHVGQPAAVRLVTSSMLSELVARVRQSGASHARAASVVRHLLVMLRWCERMGMIERAPPFQMPRQQRGQRHGGKGRAITAAEFARLLRAVRQVVAPARSAPWRRLLRGLWLSGLRLDEALRLTWGAGPLALRLDHPGFAAIVISSGADKSGRASVLPLTPDFAAWIARTPTERRTGPVFAFPGGRRPSLIRASRTISAAGRLIHSGPGKHPTAHDLRRSFATRWAFRLPPLALQSIMRHSSIQTTLGYYVDLSSTAADVAKLLADSALATNPKKNSQSY